MRHPVLVALVAGLALLTACSKKEAEKPPEKITNITTATVARKDLPITESAVGSATSLSVAQALDPTRVQRGTFTIRLPFPEHIARQLRIGQAVRLTSFDDPGRVANARVKEIRPALNSTTQTMEVIAELPGGREWYSVGSVRGEVVLGVRRGAHVVPEQAVVLRPAGSVVYVPQGETVKERVVKPGILRDGEREIIEGLQVGETVTVDGAGLLSDGARVRVVTAAGTTSGGNKP